MQLQNPEIQEAEVLGYPLVPGQLQIVGSILDPDIERLIISAMTQYGKTRAAAIGILLLLLGSREKKKVLFIAPSIDQTNIIRHYTAEHIATTPALADLVDRPFQRRPEYLKNEVSRKRLTFKNGWEILTLTAHGEEGSKDPGKQLMGFGGDIIVIDEACLILDTVYRQRIKRMIGANPHAKIIILVNPWNRLNFAYRAWINPKFTKIHIPWQQAVAEGRVTETFIQEQKEELTPYEFAVLYDSNFAEESEDVLIQYNWIERATRKNIVFESPPQTVWGLDVAEKGRDQTILTQALTDGFQYCTLDQQQIEERETIPVANHVANIVPLDQILGVDSIGVGAGVYSQLKTLGRRALSIRVSESPSDSTEAKRYLNLKSERYWLLRLLFENDLISIPKIPKLISQLSQIRYEFTPTGKIKIIDPPGKSPDYADSLMLTVLCNVARKPVVKY